MAQIIASEMVKPSSPTPSTARKYKLSSIDQVAPSFYVPFIFFYKGDGPKLHDQISRSLKKSLSETLAIFYPLSRKDQTEFIRRLQRCRRRDGGSRVPTHLSPLIQNPKVEELKHLLPDKDGDGKAILSLKTTYFDCGGFAVGSAFASRIRSWTRRRPWAATCRGEEASRIIRPALDLALRFTPREETETPSEFRLGPLEEEIVMERFVFEEEKLEKLREEASAAGEVKNPSRVEALSAFIWRSFIDAAKTTTSASSFTAGHAVNLRARAVPPFPDHKLRAAIRGFNGDCIDKVEFIEEATAFAAAGEMSEPGNCVFSSWWRFPVYDVDFGWGKPVWVSTATMPVVNFVVFIPQLKSLM